MMRFRTGLGACPNKGRYRVLVATQSQNAYSMPSESDTGLRCRCAVWSYPFALYGGRQAAVEPIVESCAESSRERPAVEAEALGRHVTKAYACDRVDITRLGHFEQQMQIAIYVDRAVVLAQEVDARLDVEPARDAVIAVYAQCECLSPKILCHACAQTELSFALRLHFLCTAAADNQGGDQGCRKSFHSCRHYRCRRCKSYSKWGYMMPAPY